MSALPEKLDSHGPQPEFESTVQANFDEQLLRGVLEQSLAGVYVVVDERFVYANEVFAAMFGYARDEFIGMRMVDCVTPDSAEEVQRNYWKRMRGEIRAIRYLTKGLHRNGKVVYLDLHASRVDRNGRPALAGLALDVTARVAAQADLQRSREELRELAKHINKSREAERARLSREVHDVLGGMLSSAKFDLARIVRRTAGAGLEDLNSIAGGLLDLLQETIDTARSISEEMRPASLDMLGLIPALRQLMGRFEARYGVKAAVHVAAGEYVVPSAVATQLYRIVQEALTNVAKHAGASQVDLLLERTIDGINLRLRDNGCGFGAKPRRPGAMGLVSMAERARGIGATFEVGIGNSGGTELLLRLPHMEPKPSSVPR